MHERTPIGIIGASGYAGLEATHLLAAHPHVELRLVTSERWAGDTVEARTGLGGEVGRLRYQPLDKSLELARGLGAVLLATPVEVSLALVPPLLAAGVRVIDLSGAFRLRDASLYPGAYKVTHPAVELLAEAEYGLPELFRPAQRPRLVSNPGCYPTAAALALAPLLRGGLLARESVVVDAASGTTGAGRKATEDMSFSEVMDDFKAYRVLKHQHTPEIAQSLARLAGWHVPLTFTPHLLPVRRGILSTAYARLKDGVSAADAQAYLVNHYAEAAFVRVLPGADAVGLRGVVGTNLCHVGLTADVGGHDPRRVVIVSAIDNLLKGAAGQAVQNLNLVMGWDETCGLTHLRTFRP